MTATLAPTRPVSTSARAGRGAAVLAGMGLLVVVPAVLAAAFTRAAAPFVIGDPGPAVRWGLVVAHAVTDLAAVLTVGGSVLAALVLPAAQQPRQPGTPQAGRPRAYRPALSLVAASATLWAAGSLTLLVLTYADALGQPLGSTDTLAQLSEYARDVPAGQGLAFTTVVAAVIGLVGAGAVGLRVAGLLAVASLVALVPAALSGHAAGAGDHETAVTAIGLHLVGVTVWVGGLLVLLVLLPSLLTSPTRTSSTDESSPAVLAVRRYSTLAGWCFGAVAFSGVLSAWIQLPGWSGLASRYGVVVLAKSALLLALGVAGFWHRRTTLARFAAGVPRSFLRLALAELAVMAVALGLGAALSLSAPPPGSRHEALTVTGYPLPPAPTVARLAFGTQPDLLWLLITGFGALGYLTSMWLLARRGDRWPLLRAVPFLLGLALLAWITSGGLAVYGRVTFSAHMVGHMVLSMVVPPLLVLGAPATLALRVLPARHDSTRGAREWLLAVLHSSVLRVLAFPPVAATLFAGSLIAFYYSGLFGLALTTHVGHELMEVHFLFAGYLFAWVLIGIDPGPPRMSYLLRLLMLFATMAFHAFFGIALLEGNTVLQQAYFAAVHRPWGPSLLQDQRNGGGLAWSIGEVPTLMLAMVLIVQWSRSDARDARRLDRAADRDGDAELTAYNAMLARLAERERPLNMRAGDDRQRLNRSRMPTEGTVMYIGGGIFLLVVGAILAFAVNDSSVGSVDLSVIGWICMGGGALAILLSLVLMNQRSNTSHTEVVERRDLGGGPRY